MFKKKEILNASPSLLHIYLFHELTSVAFPWEIFPAFSLILQQHRQCPKPFRDRKSTALLITHQERTLIPAGMLRTNQPQWIMSVSHSSES